MRRGFVFNLYKLTHNAEPVVRLLVLPPVEGRWPISREALYVMSVSCIADKKGRATCNLENWTVEGGRS